MKYLARDIRQIKLVTGDELLTEVVGEDREEFLITNPLKILKEKLVIRGAPREINFFTRWMGLADNQEFILNKRHIIAEGLVGDEIALYYNKMMENNDIDDTEMGSLKDLPHPELVDDHDSESNIESNIEEEMAIKDKDKPTIH